MSYCVTFARAVTGKFQVQATDMFAGKEKRGLSNAGAHSACTVSLGLAVVMPEALLTRMIAGLSKSSDINKRRDYV